MADTFRGRRVRFAVLVLAGAATGLIATSASGQSAGPPDNASSPPVADKPPETYAFHGQFTYTEQGDFAFKSPYAGPNSLPGGGEARETADATLFAGVRPWSGAEIWINPEIDQGFGLDNSLGVAGFPSGEAYKVGASTPYFKLQRLFLRQTIDLGGAPQAVDADLNQLGGSQTADRLVITLGKFSEVDVFDTNAYAHDPRGDFLNWSVIDAGTYDYAADAYGYSVGGAAELYVGRFAARVGLFNLSVAPNTPALEYNLSQYQLVGELEEDHQIGGHAGKVKITAFLSEGRMGGYAAAIALAQVTDAPADIAAVRRFQGRPGISLNLEQEIGDGVGLFARAGLADGSVEPFDFTDIDRTVSGGVSAKGERWGRKDDTLGLAGVLNGISKVHEAFLNDGGLGILIGDGKLPHPGPESILETYYDLAIKGWVHLSLDYQFVDNPAYNRDRGPVSILATRLHAQF